VSTYGWTIDKDHLIDQFPDIGKDEAGIRGPRDITPEIEAKLDAGEGHVFRMYDDDGELYYTGRLVGDKDDEIEGFAPLNDFGTPNAGAVRIDYKEGRSWATL
jgi:hypothetical protein